MTSTDDLTRAIVDGDTDRAESLIDEILEELPATTVLDDAILPAADTVGTKYENGEFFLTDLMRCGDTMEAVMEPLTAALDDEVATGGIEDQRVTVVLATIKEDIHDIGKNLVRLFLAGNGHHVHDLGVDVDETDIVDTAVEHDADVIALSALMSITRDNMADVLHELERRGLRNDYKVLVGGRSTSEEWADAIGADGWAPDAPRSVAEAKRLFDDLRAGVARGA